MSNKSFLSLAENFPLTAYDIGARGGPKHDLARISKSTNLVLFEPDKEAVSQLENDFSKDEWADVQIINQALGASEENFQLNLYRQRGCSSKYTADQSLADRFSRGDYYIHDGTVEVTAKPLDQVVEKESVSGPDFIKIDVQGMEGEVFTGASHALKETVVGIRAEISFYPIYEGQPLFRDLDAQLSEFGFVPMHWLEFHEWRRAAKDKYPFKTKGPLVASRGQMIHADVLFLLHPEDMPSETEAQKNRLAKLAIIACCFDQLDHAQAALERPGMREFISKKTELEPMEMLKGLSNSLARRTILERWSTRAQYVLNKLLG